jgi:hypothetical protein
VGLIWLGITPTSPLNDSEVKYLGLFRPGFPEQQWEEKGTGPGVDLGLFRQEYCPNSQGQQDGASGRCGGSLLSHW